MLSGYDSQAVALYVDDEYLCLRCAGKKLGELRVAKIVSGLAPLPSATGDSAADADELVMRYEVEEKLAEIETVRREGGAEGADPDEIDDEITGLEWGTRCSQCGTELAPLEPHQADATDMGMCRYCWADVDHPIHSLPESAA